MCVCVCPLLMDVSALRVAESVFVTQCFQEQANPVTQCVCVCVWLNFPLCLSPLVVHKSLSTATSTVFAHFSSDILLANISFNTSIQAILHSFG